MHRILTGLGIGGSITFALFAVMSFLIKSDLEVPEESEVPPIVIAMDIDEKDIELKKRRPLPEPKPPKQPPPPAEPSKSKPTKPQLARLDINMTKLAPGVGNDPYLPTSGGERALSDGDAIPMVVIQPNYPRKPAMEGIEGWVKFRFTIAADGTPKNIEVVDANPKRVFDRAARKAIYKWKFKPRIVDGKAVEQPNMTYTLDFRLSGE